MNTDAYQTVRDVVLRRATHKILADVTDPIPYTETVLARHNRIVEAAVKDAGWAPFHYARGVDGLAEPWRVHWLTYSVCRQLSRNLSQLIPHLKPGSKLPGLLAGCGSAVLFNWLPQSAGAPDKLERINQEHLAATSAVVENFLLLATAAGLETYWSSGGLWEDHLFRHLGITDQEKSIGVVFVHSPQAGGNFQVATGKNRAARSAQAAWFRRVQVNLDRPDF